MLARGELRAVGATTLDEYRKHIEKDAALERRFQPVFVGEPSVADTIAILRGLKERYEAHHGVEIRDSALVAAAVLSDRYVSDRFLPDKAIDLVDEAASRLRMQIDSSPVELDEAERRVRQLEIELAAMANESEQVRAPVERELAEAKSRRDELAARWSREKEALQRVAEIKRQLDELRMEAEREERLGNLARVAEIRYGALPELEKELAEREQPSEAPMVKEEVDEDDIAAVVAVVDRNPGLAPARGRGREAHPHGGAAAPARGRPGRGRRGRVERASPRALRAPGPEPADRLLRLPRPDRRRQDRARPRARRVHVRRRASDGRLDMSEYQERHTVARLVGAPPGYVGYEEGGQLTEAVRRRPYAVLLLDEIEKAHPEVFNVLLQLLDDGRLTDGQGRTVDFRNTVVIMTSNIRSPEELHEQFRPEFLNRIDEIVVFEPLTREQLTEIVELQLGRLRERLAERRIELELTDAAKELLAEAGWDPAYGARPLKRAIQRLLENPLALELLEGRFAEGDTVRVDVQDGELVFERAEVASPRQRSPERTSCAPSAAVRRLAVARRHPDPFVGLRASCSFMTPGTASCELELASGEALQFCGRSPPRARACERRAPSATERRACGRCG